MQLLVFTVYLLLTFYDTLSDADLEQVTMGF